jgi:predicted methyltransferase
MVVGRAPVIGINSIHMHDNFDKDPIVSGSVPKIIDKVRACPGGMLYIDKHCGFPRLAQYCAVAHTRYNV